MPLNDGLEIVLETKIKQAVFDTFLIIYFQNYSIFNLSVYFVIYCFTASIYDHTININVSYIQMLY